MVSLGGEHILIEAFSIFTRLIGHRIYLLGPGARVLRVGSAAAGVVHRIDDATRRMLAEIIRPGSCPDGFFVQPITSLGAGYYVLADLRPELEADDGAKALARLHGLTDKETEVFVLWCRGWKAKQVGEELGISAGTVKVHLRQIREKIGVSTKGEMIAKVKGFEAGMRVRR